MDGMRAVHRETVLPTATGRGRLFVTDQVVDRTVDALRASRGPDGPHEGLVLWAGRQVLDVTVVTTAVVPESTHSWGRVSIDERQVAAAARAARAVGLGVVAQVHSHPGRDTRHSDGDDTMVLMPFEGMFSLVVARYGADGFDGVGVHQHQDGRWCRITNPTQVVTILPSVIP
jgi:proteasome lid subunit RPN8/RPN11